jgi:hypothetical protein
VLYDLQPAWREVQGDWPSQDRVNLAPAKANESIGKSQKIERVVPVHVAYKNGVDVGRVVVLLEDGHHARAAVKQDVGLAF